MAFSDPIKNIEQFKLGEGMMVADLGSGSGHYAMAASNQVGDEGKVFAIDVISELANKLKSESSFAGHGNIEVINGDFESPNGTSLKDQSMDAVIFANVLFQTQDLDGALTEINRILKKKGKVLVVDWSDSFGGLGPTEGNVVREGSAKQAFENAGFEIEEIIKAGDHHYGFIARAK